jgi:N-methylhydantoinase B/oxoprolinase/acetone carboxylase alpha subunit
MWSTVIDTFCAWLGMLSHGYYMRGFREEMLGFRSGGSIVMQGYDQFGKRRPLVATPTGSPASGASGVRDGLDPGGILVTAEVDLGNAEIWEVFVPYLDLSRRLDPYSVGHGKFRSGACVPHFFMIHGGRDIVGSAMGTGGTFTILPNLGACGGYPGGRRFTSVLRDTNVAELIAARKPLIHQIGHPGHPDYEDKLKANVWIPHHIPEPFSLADDDIVISASSSPGGFGDAIERDTASIRRDLDNGLTTQDIAENVYGAEIRYDNGKGLWAIDEEATAGRREAKRKERIERAVPVREWWKKSRRRLAGHDIDPLLAEMYASSMKLSNRFAGEIREFWALPEDWQPEVSR